MALEAVEQKLDEYHAAKRMYIGLTERQAFHFAVLSYGGDDNDAQFFRVAKKLCWYSMTPVSFADDAWERICTSSDGGSGDGETDTQPKPTEIVASHKRKRSVEDKEKSVAEHPKRARSVEKV